MTSISKVLVSFLKKEKKKKASNDLNCISKVALVKEKKKERKKGEKEQEIKRDRGINRVDRDK